MERDVATGGNNLVAMAKVPAVGNTADGTAAAEFEVVPARPMAGLVVPMGAMFGLLALPHVDAIVAIVMSVCARRRVPCSITTNTYNIRNVAATGGWPGGLMGMYFLTVLGETRVPNFTKSSLAMRSSPHKDSRSPSVE